MRPMALAAVSLLALPTGALAAKSNQQAQAVLNLPLLPVQIARDHVTLTQALGAFGVYVQGGYTLFGIELRAKDGKEPLVSLNLTPGSRLGDALRQIMAQMPGYEYEVVSQHMINIFPLGARKDQEDVLNIAVPQFDVTGADAVQILTSPMDFIPELAAWLWSRNPGESPKPTGYGGEVMRSTNPPVTLHLKNTTVRQILNAVSEATEQFPPDHQPLGWSYLYQPDQVLKTGGKHLWMFLFTAPKNWKPVTPKSS